MIKYEIPEILKRYEEIIAKTFRYSNEITFKCEETKQWESKLGGCPYFVQNDYIGFDDDTFLLLQLDIEDECGIMFGDSGNCTFTMSKDDLKKRDFSMVIYDWQCC